jgi:hypothetical protein
VKPGLFAVVLEAISEKIAGTGFPIVQGSALEVPPPGLGLVTATEYIPRSPPGMATFSCVLLMYVVARFSPLNCTLAPFTKFAPCTTKVKPKLFATTVLGLTLEITGMGFSGVR